MHLNKILYGVYCNEKELNHIGEKLLVLVNLYEYWQKID